MPKRRKLDAHYFVRGPFGIFITSRKLFDMMWRENVLYWKELYND